jgi:hypothetical protein
LPAALLSELVEAAEVECGTEAADKPDMEEG